MPRKPCYWTRKLELELVDFVRRREFIWKPLGNTNHQIQQKYKAYAEFAAELGRGFTARSVRDRWVNIRSTFNHNLRRVDKSKETATSPAEIYVPCWPLWKPLQFLRDTSKKDDGSNFEDYTSLDQVKSLKVKEENSGPEIDEEILQRGKRTDRPRRKTKYIEKDVKVKKCKKVVDDLIRAMNPLLGGGENQEQSYWFFGKHVTERLNSMRSEDAECACREIMNLLEENTMALKVESFGDYNRLDT